MAPDVREKFLVREYLSDSFDRMLKTHRHPLDAAGLMPRRKLLERTCKVYQDQEKRQQAERVPALMRGRGRGRGGPSRS
jgi:hypothetical protein